MNKRQIVVYVAGKYSDNDKKKIRKHSKLSYEYAAKIWDMGFTVICPHGNIGLEIDKYTKNTNYKDVMKGSIELLDRSDILFLLPNWRESKGAIREYRHAKKHDMPIVGTLCWLEDISNDMIARYKNGKEN